MVTHYFGFHFADVEVLRQGQHKPTLDCKLFPVIWSVLVFLTCPVDEGIKKVAIYLNDLFFIFRTDLYDLSDDAVLIIITATNVAFTVES